MAMNPMKRKSRVSFLLGMLITMLLAGGVIAFLIFQMRDIQDKIAYAESGSVYVLSEDVKSSCPPCLLHLVKFVPPCSYMGDYFWRNLVNHH